jgi:hypothetical protein
MKYLQYKFNDPSVGDLPHREKCKLVFVKCPTQSRSALQNVVGEDSMVFLGLYRKIMAYVPYKSMTIAKN